MSNEVVKRGISLRRPNKGVNCSMPFCIMYLISYLFSNVMLSPHNKNEPQDFSDSGYRLVQKIGTVFYWIIPGYQPYKRGIGNKSQYFMHRIYGLWVGIELAQIKPIRDSY
jgi:hypothetical protein